MHQILCLRPLTRFSKNIFQLKNVKVWQIYGFILKRKTIWHLAGMITEKIDSRAPCVLTSPGNTSNIPKSWKILCQIVNAHKCQNIRNMERFFSSHKIFWTIILRNSTAWHKPNTLNSLTTKNMSRSINTTIITILLYWTLDVIKQKDKVSMVWIQLIK